MTEQFELGLVEGYYGPPWDSRARRSTIELLASFGYRFYIYAPKADRSLRGAWGSQPVEALGTLADNCRHAGVDFGVGVTPLDVGVGGTNDGALYGSFASALDALDEIGTRTLAILFDDLAGADALETQVALAHRIAERTHASRIIVCPTYCSDDPLLDRTLGARPPRYLERLGAALDPAIDIFWTGEAIVAASFGTARLEEVGTALRRAPVLWDNYPVNDGAEMSRFLHLRAFTGRPASIQPLIRAHAINPALQPVLTRIPALTLADSYREGARYDPERAFAVAACAVLGAALAAQVRSDLHWFEVIGCDRLGDEASRLRECYRTFDHDAAREILAWIDGRYRSTIDLIDVNS